MIGSMPLRALIFLLLWPATALAAQRVELEIGRIEGPGWSARGLQLELDTDGGFSARSGPIAARALPAPLPRAQLACRIGAAPGGWRCSGGRLQAGGGKAGELRGGFELDYRAASDWRLQLRGLQGEVSGQDRSERYVAEKLGLALDADLQRRSQEIRGHARLRLRSGQGYADPVFGDFSAHPLQLESDWSYALRTRRLQLSRLQLQQAGIGRLDGELQLSLAAPKTTLAGRLHSGPLALQPFAELYLSPFLAGTRLSGLTAAGTARLDLTLRAGAPQQAQLQFEDATLQLGKLALGFEGLAGSLHWAAAAPAPASSLRWTALRYGRLEAGPAALQFHAAARDFELLHPLHLGLYEGALQLNRLQLRRFGQPDMSAAFDAGIEPIALAPLSRALGWPEFSGTLAGRLPGVRLENEVLSFDGALTARVFDGDVTIDGLRVIQPFGVLPRVAADLRLRNLDLKAVTGAFSFGRIEGRLSGDFLGLRLLGWRPVAMDARLYTPPGDRSRHRISQRAIDSISRAGGGPAGLLQRSALRLFDDFAYDRIGWSCRLDDGICEMGGLEPAKNGGYVLVKGRLLPRIDVVGYSRRVGWETFLGQLKAAMEADKAEVRRD